LDDYLAQAHWHHFHYRIGEMVGLNRTRREVHIGPVLEENGTEVMPARSYPYDTLVLAVGSLTNDFGTPGVVDHAICLETTEQATRFHRRLVNACMRAQNQIEPLRPGQLQVGYERVARHKILQKCCRMGVLSYISQLLGCSSQLTNTYHRLLFGANLLD
jgi:hypothetical protein